MSFDLDRFVQAQQQSYSQARAELAAGRKQTHWIWFIFPQIHGLGSSPISQRYAIQSLDEARAYLRHPLLGPRLRECAVLVNQIRGKSLEQALGYPDDLKFHSSMTLFAQAADGSDPEDEVFIQALDQWFSAKRDQATLDRV